MLHSKSSEVIQFLYAKKRVKHKVLIAEKGPAPLMRSHLIQKDAPIAWRNWSQDTQEPIAFHNQSWHKASSGAFVEFAHRKSFTVDRDDDRIYTSHKSIVLPRKTSNVIIYFICFYKFWL